VILCFLVHGSQLEYKTPLTKSPLSKYLCGHGKNSRENVVRQSMDPHKQGCQCSERRQAKAGGGQSLAHTGAGDRIHVPKEREVDKTTTTCSGRARANMVSSKKKNRRVLVC